MKRTCKYLSFGAAAVLIAMMMTATFVERFQGTPVAFQWFYHSPLFILLWAVAAIAGVIYLVMEGTPKRLWTMGPGHLPFRHERQHPPARRGDHRGL